ncbi:DUF3021 domain-containing protein [Limosilactobacillus sp.]|uniref:DUF3021 domain-containing protein n=1 Tax=Limosilactobacillus sp. TaxID=2773925 RepID=UPI003F058554
MQKLFRRFCTGIGFAATTYLVMLTLQFQRTMPTMRNTTSVLIVGGLIGLLSLIFDTDLSYLAALLTHFILTVILASIMIAINHWHLNLASFLMIVLIYVIIWGITRINQDHDVRQINQKLRNRK